MEDNNNQFDSYQIYILNRDYSIVTETRVVQFGFKGCPVVSTGAYDTNLQMEVVSLSNILPEEAVLNLPPFVVNVDDIIRADMDNYEIDWDFVNIRMTLYKEKFNKLLNEIQEQQEKKKIDDWLDYMESIDYIPEYTQSDRLNPYFNFGAEQSDDNYGYRENNLFENYSGDIIDDVDLPFNS